MVGLSRARTWVRIFGKGQNSDLEAKLGQNKVRIWFKSQNNGFFVKDNERIFNERKLVLGLQHVKKKSKSKWKSLEI